MYQRRLLIFILLVVVVSLGFLLFVSLRPSNLFRIAAPAVTVVTPASNLKDLQNAVSASTVEKVSGTTILENPRYTGQDAQGRNWLLTAETAGQEGTSTSGTYILQQVNATLNDPSQTLPFKLSANEGRYTQTSSTLLLTGTVSASGIGFTLTAPRVDADLNTRKLQASGGSHVIGQVGGNAGQKGWDVNIAAPTLNADQNTGRLLLTGGVHATFTPMKAQ